MEVHHHTHSHEKKNWKDYFWEFLMLFLAVFAGFLAENQREHIIEKKRAHQFLQSMLVDVRTNTQNLDSLITRIINISQTMTPCCCGCWPTVLPLIERLLQKNWEPFGFGISWFVKKPMNK